MGSFGGALARLFLAAVVGAAATPTLVMSHDLAGINSERLLRQQGTPFDKSLSPAKPTDLAKQLARAREQEQAFKVLFPVNSAAPSYMAQLLKGSAAPYSIFNRFRKWKPGTTLKVCFHSAGAADVKSRIAQIATQWSAYGAIYFDFGKAPVYRLCQAGDGAVVRVSFRQKGYFSRIGNRAMLSDVNNEVTMGLQDLDEPRYPIDGEKFKSIVIHEFGHAIGLAHEHQHPAADCYPQFDLIAIKQAYEWNDQEADENLKTLQVSSVATEGNSYKTGLGPDGDIYVFSNVPDKLSVMRYDLRPGDFYQPPGSCFDPTTNSEPSKGDQDAVARAYPKTSLDKGILANNALIENVLRANPNITSVERAALKAFKF
jgi:hypothetical protein